jgi:hypothetical protein
MPGVGYLLSVSVIDCRCRLSMTFSLVGAPLMSDRLTLHSTVVCVDPKQK